MLIFYGGGDDLFFLVCPPFVESPAGPFIGSRGGRDVRECLRDEVLSSVVEAAIATCPKNDRSSPDTCGMQALLLY
jgi:hypothetical protein